MDNTYNWKIFRKSVIYSEILDKWKALLDNKLLKEKDYHHFLAQHPAIFLTIYDCYLVISKLKLGADYETDFVLLKDGYSDGNIYEIIEIETPHTKLFDKKGKPSASLNSSLQQIRDWRRWLAGNKSEFKKVFPTTNTRVIKDSRLKFRIIIGRRDNDQEALEKRRQIEEQEDVEILSFDRLTDIARQRKVFWDVAQIPATEFEMLDYLKKNKLANPFFRCTSDSEWRSIQRKGTFHFYSNMIDEILAIRTYNEYFEKYKQLNELD